MYVFFLNHISFFVPKLTDTFLNNHWSWAAGKIPQNTPELTSSPGCLNKKSHYYSMYAIASSRGITIRLNSIMQKKLWRLVFRRLVQKFRRPKRRSRCWSMILNWSKASTAIWIWLKEQCHQKFFWLLALANWWDNGKLFLLIRKWNVSLFCS